MKNIYERLNPDILASINKDKEKYPATTKYLIQTLKTCKFWTDLTVGDVQTVINHSHDSFYELSMKDLMWGDKFLIDEEK